MGDENNHPGAAHQGRRCIRATLLETFDLTALLIIGLLTGLVGGMLGIGGSIVMIPAMTEVLGPNQHLYQATAMIVNFFVAVPAVYQHALAKAIEPATVVRLVPTVIVAVIIGVGLSELPLFAGEGEAYLRGLFGLFLLSVAAGDLYRLLRPGATAACGTGILPVNHGLEARATIISRTGMSRTRWRLTAAIALPTGLVAGLLGVGGGVLAVPLQRRFLRAPMRTAIANSAAIIVATSFIGAIAKNYALAAETGRAVRPLALAAVLIPTAIVGSLMGSRLAHRLPLKFIKTVFFVLLLVVAVRLIYAAARPL